MNERMASRLSHRLNERASTGPAEISAARRNARVARVGSIAAVAKPDAFRRGARSCYSRVIPAKEPIGASHLFVHSLNLLGKFLFVRCSETLLLLFACLTGETLQRGIAHFQANPGFFGKLGFCAMQQKVPVPFSCLTGAKDRTRDRSMQIAGGDWADIRRGTGSYQAPVIRHLLSPVMLSGKPRIAWIFRAITGEKKFDLKNVESTRHESPATPRLRRTLRSIRRSFSEGERGRVEGGFARSREDSLGAGALDQHHPAPKFSFRWRSKTISTRPQVAGGKVTPPKTKPRADRDGVLAISNCGVDQNREAVWTISSPRSCNGPSGWTLSWKFWMFG